MLRRPRAFHICLRVLSLSKLIRSFQDSRSAPRVPAFRSPTKSIRAHLPGPMRAHLETNPLNVSSQRRIAGYEVIVGGFGRTALGGHHLENRLAISNFFLDGEDHALGRGFLDDRWDC